MLSLGFLHTIPLYQSFGLNTESVHSSFGKFNCETFIYEAMAINQYFSIENVTYNDNFEVSFTRLWHMTSTFFHGCMMRMFVALIYYFKVVRVEFKAEFLFNVSSNGLLIFLIFMILIYSCGIIIILLSHFFCKIGGLTSLSLLIGIIRWGLRTGTTRIHGTELWVNLIPE